MKLEEKAKTLPEVVETCDFLRDICKDCFGQCEFEGTEHFKGKWVTLSDAQKELGEIETQFAEEVMKYKLELEKERSELKQKLRQWMKVYGFTIGDDIGYNKLKELLK